MKEDWSAWLPNEMDQLFDATRGELESSNVILSISLDEALSLCGQGQLERARETSAVFVHLFDRLAISTNSVIQTIRDHGSHFGTLPNVTPLSTSNFRGGTAQRISKMSGLLSRVVFSGRTRFFHKLDSLRDIIGELQKEAHLMVKDVAGGRLEKVSPAWNALEVLGYDLNTCMGETTVVLKSFFCALPLEELEPFRLKLVAHIPAVLALESRRSNPVRRR